MSGAAAAPALENFDDDDPFQMKLDILSVIYRVLVQTLNDIVVSVDG